MNPGRFRAWYYGGGVSGIDSYDIALADDPYELISPDPPVAVLTDRRTASSGEATAIVFRGRSEARTFGESTAGLSTANAAFPLSDGALIVLTVSTMADRTGQLYGKELVSDEVIEGEKTGDPTTDAPLRRALDWLHTRPSCQ